jgi:hypothetical protein
MKKKVEAETINKNEEDTNTHEELRSEFKTKFTIIAFGRGFVILVKTADLIEQYLCHQPWYWIPEAYTIRRWGTNNGLGELATLGPLKETILDCIPHGIYVPIATIHGIFPINNNVNDKFVKVLDKAKMEILNQEKK